MSNTSCRKLEKECIGNRYNVNLLFLLIVFMLVARGLEYNVIPYTVFDQLRSYVKM